MQDPHVAVFVFPFASHPAALFSIIRRLAVATPNAHFSIFGTAKSNASISASSSGFESRVKLFDVSHGTRPYYAYTGRPQEDIELFLTAAPGGFRRSMKAAEEATGNRRVTCVVSDAFLWFTKDMAEELNVPWAAFWIANAKSICAHFYTDTIREWVGAAAVQVHEVEKRIDLVPGLSELLVGDLPEGIVFENTRSMFSDMLHKMSHTLQHASAVFLNSFEELDPCATTEMKSKLTNFLNVGPVGLFPTSYKHPIPDPSGCIPWLKTQNHASVAYISFGTFAVPPPNELAAIAEALEESGIPFLWSLRDNAKDQLPEGFVENSKNGKIVSWSPQVEVLTNGAVGVFVTVYGWNSVMESICGGVPMIGRPVFADHRVNKRMAVDVLKVGMGVEVFTKEGLVRDLKKILYGDEGLKMRKNVEVLKRVAEMAVRAKGSSSKNFNALSAIVLSGSSHHCT